MAGIGLYGVFYKPCKKVDGVCVGYDGTMKMMGKAVDASFTPTVPTENPLYANNGVSENDTSSGSGGSLALTLDRMTLEVAADLYGTQVRDVSFQVGEEKVDGIEIVYYGSEVSVPVGTAYISLQQEDGVRSHEVVFFREATYTRPAEDAKTMDKSLEWKTPKVSATVTGMQGDGSEPWHRKARFATQTAAIAYIHNLLDEEISPEGVAAVANELNKEDDE
ncbi:MAG: hypothetical protein IJ955_10320 [Oscillospiraceae bacterium]|nr:hypothetical protein [Oscillospiraceae bacterium]